MYKLFLVFFFSSFLAAQPVVSLGADQLTADASARIANKNVAVVSNAVSLCSDGMHIIDRLLEQKIAVKAVFSPEHGFASASSAGEKIGNSTYKNSGIPVYSLYGTLRKPTAEMLQNVDIIIYDLQDVGARFYTYISTMVNIMQAAAEYHKEVIILDRPNPLGGNLIDGPVLDPQFTSFVGIVPIPVVYGLTCGELAKMIQGEQMASGLASLELTVIPMKHYQRKMRYSDTGLQWVAPSPNLPTALTAIIYPGTCMFEATNLSEGRGTDAPFLTIGGPDIDAALLAKALAAEKIAGLNFDPVEFTPRSIAGKSVHPKRENELCKGIKITVTDPDKVQPFAAGVQLIYAFMQAGGDSVVLKKSSFERLSGVAEIFRMLKQGKKPADIIAWWQPQLVNFRSKSEKYTLYK